MGIGRQTRRAEDKQLDEADTAITALFNAHLTTKISQRSLNPSSNTEKDLNIYKAERIVK
jgi:hypothetical protein